MDEINTLIAAYPGDAAWQEYAAAFVADWDRFEGKAEALSLFGDRHMAMVVAYVMGEHAVAWYDAPIPALGGHTPRAVRKNHPNGQIALRALLMRMPV